MGFHEIRLARTNMIVNILRKLSAMETLATLASGSAGISATLAKNFCMNFCHIIKKVSQELLPRQQVVPQAIQPRQQ